MSFEIIIQERRKEGEKERKRKMKEGKGEIY
jgi:hypothetical protein